MRFKHCATLLFLSTALAPAAELRPETIAAWDQQVHAADLAMERGSSHFLWIDSVGRRAGRLRTGEAVVSPLGATNPSHIPSGLIHHWVGTIFIQGTTLSDVLSTVRDYDRYRIVFAPGVVESKLKMRRGTGTDEFSLVVVNQSLFLKSAIECDYRVAYHHPDSTRFYSISDTIQLREVSDYGQPGQRYLNDQEGSGYIWRLHTISRYLERDGGVYVEMETFALSREIPTAVRWLAEPIVRRVSHHQLELTLKQTHDAVLAGPRMAISASGR